MPVGTEQTASMPRIWHKEYWPLDLANYRFAGEEAVALNGTQCQGTLETMKLDATGDYVSWGMPVLPNWDGTCSFVFRYAYAQVPDGAQKDATCIWDFNYWPVEAWGEVIGSKTVTLSATNVYGDEGTTNNCLHTGTFEMDLTSGTYGTVAVGQYMFFVLSRPTNAETDQATVALLSAWVEYMVDYVGPTNVKYDTMDKEGR